MKCFLKKKFVLILSVVFLFSASVLRAENNGPPHGYGTEVTYELLVGNESNTATGQAYQQIIRDNFSWMVSGNWMKFDAIHPQENVYDWTITDQVVAWANANNKKFKSHGLAYFHDDVIPSWFSGLPTAEARRAALKSHIQTIALRYRDSIDVWEITNEDLSWALMNSLLDWTDTEIVVNCFKWARETLPDATLVINYAGQFAWGYNEYVQFVNDCLAQGAPIDAIGTQGHLTAGEGSVQFTTEYFKSIISALSSGTGLPVHVTEFDIAPESGVNPDLPYDGFNTWWDWQADKYKNMYDAVRTHPDVEMHFIWGIRDGTWHLWREGAGLFDVDLNPKPAYTALQALLTGSVSEPKGFFKFNSVASDVDFDATKSYDLQGSIVSYEWDFGDGSTGSGVTTSHTYNSTGIYTVSLTLTNTGGKTFVVTKEISASGGGTGSVSKSINFQPAAVSVPSGYLVDDGAVFGDRGNGDIYGWYGNANNNTRDRNNTSSPDQRYDTINHINNNVWELELPNGEYDVHLVMGDPSYTSINGIDLENVVVADPDGSDNFDEFDIRVTVSDGKLTMKRISGQTNTIKVCYMDISTVSGTTNQAPVADVQVTGGQTTGQAPFSVTFDGSGSTDSDGTIVSHAWDFGDGTDSGETVSHTFNTPGTYNVALTVTDDQGATDNDYVSIEVTATPDTEAPEDPSNLVASAPAYNQVNLTWNASDDNVEVTGYRIYRDSVFLLEVAATTHQDTNGIVAETQYTYYVTAVDAAGNESGPSLPDSVTTPAAPTTFVKINFQPAAAAVPAGYLVDSGAIFADRGNGHSYGWVNGGNNATRDRNNASAPDQRYDTLNHVNSNVWEITVPNGDYEVHLVMGDPSYTGTCGINLEGTDYPDPDGRDYFDDYDVTVTVADGKLTLKRIVGQTDVIKYCFIDISPVSGTPNEAPVAVAGSDVATGDAPLTVNFNSAGSSDTDGSIVSYDWDFGDGNSSDQENPTHTYTEVGSFTATLTVVDDDDAVATATVDIEVTQANRAPTIDSTSPADPATQTVDTVQDYSIIASDLDTQDTLSYSWTLDDTAVGTNSDIYTYSPTTVDLGEHTLVVTVSDGNGGTASFTWTITVVETADTNPPVLTMSTIIVKGNITDFEGTVETLTIDGAAVTFDAAGDFQKEVTLTGATTVITIVATDDSGNTETKTVTVTK